jgi:hypothetical protein
MPRNVNGDYTLPLPPVEPGEIIEADWANTTLADIEQAITDSLDRYGRGSMVGPFYFSDGTIVAPGAAWANAPATGFYRDASGVGFVWGQEEIFRYGVIGITMNPSCEIFNPAVPSTDQSLTNKAYVNAAVAAVPIGNYLPLAGGVMSGDIGFDPTVGLSFKTADGTALAWKIAGGAFTGDGDLGIYNYGLAQFAVLYDFATNQATFGADISVPGYIHTSAFGIAWAGGKRIYEDTTLLIAKILAGETFMVHSDTGGTILSAVQSTGHITAHVGDFIASANTRGFQTSGGSRMYDSDGINHVLNCGPLVTSIGWYFNGGARKGALTSAGDMRAINFTASPNP